MAFPESSDNYILSYLEHLDTIAFDLMTDATPNIRW